MVALGALALMQAGVAAGQAIYGNAQRKKAEAAADKSMASMRATVEQGLTNQYAGLQAATQEFELQDQQTQALIAQNAQMLRESGAEGVIGGVGNLVQAGHQSGLQTAAKIEGAEFELDKLEAAEQSRLDQLQQQQLLGLGQQELMGAQAAGQEARQNIYQGIGGITNAMAGLGGFLGQKELQKTAPQPNYILPV